MTATKATPFAFGSSNWPGLAKLIEEAGEVVQVAGKLVMTGGQRAHWDGTDLQTRLIEEMADVVAAVQFVSVYNLTDLEVAELEARVEKKLKQFIDWHVFGERGDLPALRLPNGEWRCACPADEEFDVSINPAHVAHCDRCGKSRPPR